MMNVIHVADMQPRSHTLQDPQALKKAKEAAKQAGADESQGSPDIGPAAVYDLSDEGKALAAKAAKDGAAADASNAAAPQPEEEPAPAANAADAPQPKESGKGTWSSDKNVDQEINRLKERKRNLQAGIQQATDPNEKAALKQQLRQLEAEIQKKDSESYRKSHAKYWQE